MSRKIAITLSVLTLAGGGCAADQTCEDCLHDHSGAPDAGPDGSDDPDQPAGGPAIQVLTSQVLDERADGVRFTATGVPRAFEHLGEPVDIGGEGCPVVYKHAFLLRPDHGAEELPANPLELRFRVTADPAVGVDPDGVAYRVRAQGESEYATDWLPAPGSGDVFTAGLDRAAVPELVSAGAPLEIEMRGRDRDGHEVTARRCVDLRPLAGPLQVGQPVAMPRFSLLYRDPVSRILNGQAAWPLIQIAIINGTTDPVYTRLNRSAVTGTCSKEWQKWNVLGSLSTGAQSCESNPTLCAPPDLDPVVDHDDPVACSPSLGSTSSLFDLRVAIDGVVVEQCAGCAADEVRLPPGSTAVVSLVAVDVPGLQPRESGEPEETYADQEVLYRTATSGAGGCPGAADCRSMYVAGRVTTRSGCSKTGLVNGQLACTERRTYKMVRALTSVSATFNQLSIDVGSVSLEAGGEPSPPTGYGAPRTLSSYSWGTNAGSNVPDA